MDQTDEPAKYKMIRLRSCLEIKTEEAILRLSFSLAKNVPKCRFGGKRRQLQSYLEEVNRVNPLVQEGNIQGLKAFADFVVRTVIMLREHRRWNELQPGSLLFTVVVKKTSDVHVDKMFSLGSEAHRPESLETLREWITEE